MCPDSEPDPRETPRTRAFRAEDSLSLEALQRIDELCLAFEDAWQAGTPPQLEQFFGATTEPERSALLGELLRLELEYLSRRGEIPAVEHYQARFPDHQALIAEVFQEHLARVAEARPPGTRIRYFGDYEILEEISQGGMGIVYKARQLSLNRVVALKMIRSGHLASPNEVERFHREAEAAANLQHPNIVAIHEVGEHEGQHYFSMDFVEGQNLAQLIAGSPQPAAHSAKYVQTIAQAIDYAHQRGVLHRDLKPANVLIDPTGQLRITDFGLAKRLEADSGLTHTREILGTPSYMPPEQAAGHWADVGPQSDVYSLGAILYELLTGRPPFCGETATDTLSQVLHAEPIAPRRLNPKVPQDLETITLKCLEKERAKRYPTAEALADDLGRYLEDQPILARPISRTQRLWRWCRRKPALATALGVAVSALLVTLVTLTVAVVLIGRSRNEARGLAQDNETLAMDERSARTKAETNLYISQITLADREWRANNVASAERLLNTCPENLRHWEWYYLKRLCNSEYLTIAAKASEKYPSFVAPRVTYSPDGARLAYGGPSIATTIWDARTGVLMLTLEGSCGWPAFSPNGQRIIVGDKKRRAAEWDTLTGRVVRTFSGQLELCGVYSPDGKRIAAAMGNRVTLLDEASGRDEFGLNLEGNVACLAFSPSAQHIAIAVNREDGVELAKSASVSVYEMATGLEILRLREEGILTCVAFSPDGNLIAVGRVSDDPGIGDVRLWDRSSGELVRTLVLDNRVDHSGRRCQKAILAGGDVLAMFPIGPFFGVSDVTFDGTGKKLACAAWDGMTRIWDMISGREFATLRGQAGVCSSVVFRPDGKWIATSNSDGTIRVWEVASPEARQVPGFGCALGVAFSADRNRLMVAAGTALAQGGVKAPLGDGQIRVFDTRTGELLLRRATPSVARAISPDGQWIAVSSDNENLVIQQTSTGREAWTCGVTVGGMDPSGRTHAVAFSHDSQHLAVGTTDEAICVFETRTGRELRSFRAPGVTCLVFSPDDQRIAWGGTHPAVCVLDARNGQVLTTFRGHSAPIHSLSFSPDGRCVASTADPDCLNPAQTTTEVWVWHAATGRAMFSLGGDSEGIFSAAWSPGGDRLVTAGLAAVRIWDAVTGREVLAIPFSGVCAAFAADGQQIVVDAPVKVFPSAVTTHTSPYILDARARLKEQRAAQLLVDSLFDEHVLSREVLGQIRTYPHFDEQVRQAALTITQTRLENPELLNWEAWQAVHSTGCSNNFYRTWLRRAQSLCQAYPDRGDYRVTLGVAQYRIDDIPSAVETLASAERLLMNSPEGVSPACLAYLAMTQHKLGNVEEARARLDQLRGKWVPGTESEEFLRAAEAMVPNSCRQELVLQGFTGHLRFRPDDSLLVGMNDGTVVRYDAELKNVTDRCPSTLRGAENLAVSPDGNRLAVVRKEGQIELLELPAGRSVCTIAVPGFKAAGAVFSPDSQRLAVVVSSKLIEDQHRWENPEDGGLRIHSASDGSLIFAEKTPALSASWQCLDWKSNLIAIQEAYEEDKRGVLLWDVESHKKIHHLLASTLSTAISPDGEKVAAGLGGSGDVLVWSVKTGKLLHTLKGHANWTVCLAFSPDGRRLASGSGDSTVRVWDPDTGEVVYVFRMAEGPSVYTHSLSFDSTGRRLACGGSDGKIVIWELRR